VLNNYLIALVFATFCCFSCFSQKNKTPKDSLPVTLKVEKKTRRVKRKVIYDPLRPAKATFLSAVVPGLGQAYNKKYWKIPIVYGALGTGIYFFITNNREHNRFRDAFKNRLAGFSNDEFFFDAEGNLLEEPRVSDDGLVRAQRLFRRNSEIALLVTAGIYVLNIIDANVDAHLLQYNIDENLTLAPHFKLNSFDRNTTDLGLTLNLKF
jgi:hypothetical protein